MELEAVNYLKFVLALVFVLGLIGGFAILAKRAGLGNRGPIVRGKSKRLSIVESMSLDPKRRVVLIRRDNAEHLVLLGTQNEQIIETGLAVKDVLEEARPSKPSFLKTSDPVSYTHLTLPTKA